MNKSKLTFNTLSNKMESIKRTIFNIFLILPGIIFLVIGFRWLIVPEDAAYALMMPLLSGAGLNSQIGDIGGLFLGMGLLIMAAVTKGKAELVFSVSILLFCIATYRLLSFSLHDATLVLEMFVVEFVLGIWFLVASRKLGKKEPKNA
jgi:hypothetical protein